MPMLSHLRRTNMLVAQKKVDLYGVCQGELYRVLAHLDNTFLERTKVA
jgi:hypothetical protein